MFVTEAGWYGVDVDTVRGVTLGLTAATWEWPLVTGHRVTAPPLCGQRVLSRASHPSTLSLFSSSAPEESVILSVKEDKPTHQVVAKSTPSV